MTRTRRHSLSSRAFSLIEVLMAIFILGIGAISIAALFPAGIAQQQQSGDDVMGPIVANNAIEILRTKLEQGTFGSFEHFGVFAPRLTIEGDWPWLRPTHVFTADEAGAIDVFSRDRFDDITANRSWEFFAPDGYPGSSPTLYGVPYNVSRYRDDGPPRVLFTQGERSYPQGSRRPQYVWDCMFRRFQGRVFVAIFVYRVTSPGGEQAGYAVAPESNTQLPPLPVWRELTDSSVQDAWDPYGADAVAGTFDDAIVEGADCDQYLPFDLSMAWQESGQWILDQNNNVHRVLSAYCEEENSSDPRIVELVRPVPAMPPIGPYYVGVTGNGLALGEVNVVTDIWYLPPTDRNDVRITPVYVTVKEL